MEYDELVKKVNELSQEVENLKRDTPLIYNQNDKINKFTGRLMVPIKETGAEARVGEIMSTSSGVLYVGNAVGVFLKVGSQ